MARRPNAPRAPVAGGCLSVVPTPLGDPDDLSLRALRVLREADVVAAEDTRVAGALLAHHGLSRPLLSCHDHNEETRAAEIVARVRAGARVALVSDAGTPLVSDPGYRVIQAALAADVPLEVLPGPCAAITALVGAGLPVDRFLFVGFLPRDAGPRDALLAEVGHFSATLVAYESPQRLATTLAALAARWPTRRVCVARNLTKLHEQWIRGTAAEAAAVLGDETRGEVVLLVAPPAEASPDAPADLDAAIDALLAQGRSPREIRDVLEGGDLPKRELYQRVLARVAARA
jgi:16S rRNA (cytidine1402-2'-O)-methyltransferase